MAHHTAKGGTYFVACHVPILLHVDPIPSYALFWPVAQGLATIRHPKDDNVSTKVSLPNMYVRLHF